MEFLTTYNIDFDNQNNAISAILNYLKVVFWHTDKIGNYKHFVCNGMFNDIINVEIKMKRKLI